METYNTSFESILQESLTTKKAFEEISNLMHSTASMETLRGLSNASSTFLSSAFTKVSDIFTSFFNREKVSLFSYQEAMELDKELKRHLDLAKHNFIELAYKEVPYITSCKVDLLTLSRDLKGLLNSHQEIVTAITIEADTLISKAMTSEEFRENIRPFKPSSVYQKASKWVKDVEEFKFKTFDPEKKADREKVSNILPNVSLSREIWDNIQICVKNFNEKELNNLQREINSIAQKADALAEQLSNGEFHCSSESINEIERVLKLSAEAVTSLSIVQHSLNQLILAYAAVIGELIKSK